MQQITLGGCAGAHQWDADGCKEEPLDAKHALAEGSVLITLSTDAVPRPAGSLGVIMQAQEGVSMAIMTLKTKASALLLLQVLWMGGCQPAPVSPNAGFAGEVTADILPVMGRHNWIIIADSAYPWQAGDDVKTIVTGENQLDAVKEVLAVVDRAPNVRPDIYLDAELSRVPESDAPGVTAYRDQLQRLLATRPIQRLPHEQITRQLDKAGATFRILILKTNLSLAYGSVFLQLDARYWSPEAEMRLRKAMGEASRVSMRKAEQ